MRVIAQDGAVTVEWMDTQGRMHLTDIESIADLCEQKADAEGAEADLALAAKGCEVIGGTGCHYKSEAGYCDPCKASLRLKRNRYYTETLVTLKTGGVFAVPLTLERAKLLCGQ